MLNLKNQVVGILAVLAMLFMAACSENPLNSQAPENFENFERDIIADDSSVFESSSKPEEIKKGIINLLVNPEARDGRTGWWFYGNSGVTDVTQNKREFYTRDHIEQPSHIWQDVDLPYGSGGKFLLMYGFGWVEKIVENSITRHPYLYGYQMSNPGYIVQYMQGQHMLHTVGANTWQELYGIFPIEAETRTIRFFLNQASQVGDTPDGTMAKYDNLEMIVFETLEEAELYVASKTRSRASD
ncbi:MAG: hypothetical protein JXA92_12500 [candidate division Zixibacteria bacterium]|nr:hypothetical protein [candidate division Zixibacteria bacterium]